MPPSLFDFHANVTVNESSLKASNRTFHMPQDLPNLKSHLQPNICSVSLALIDGILDVELQVPLYNIELDERSLLPPIEISSLDNISTSIIAWLNSSMEVLSTPESLKNGRIPSNFYLQMMRALAFIESSESTAVRSWEKRRLYALLSNLMAGTSLYRYCVTVLEPLIDDFPKLITRRTFQMTELLECMSNSIGSWIVYCETVLPKKLNADVSYKLSFHSKYNF
jgi:hypothetical protein